MRNIIRHSQTISPLECAILTPNIDNSCSIVCDIPRNEKLINRANTPSVSDMLLVGQ